MPITPDEFINANAADGNAFDADFGAAVDAAVAQTVARPNPDPDPSLRDPVPTYVRLGSSSTDDDIVVEGVSSADLGVPISTWVWDTSDNHPHRAQRRHLVNRFHTAIREGNAAIVLAFVRRGLVSPDVPDERGWTPLASAILCTSPSLTMVKLLLDLGAGVDVLYPDPKVWAATSRGKPREAHGGRTPLMAASRMGLLAIVKLLMDAGADDSIIAPDGAMALRLAADNGHRDIVAFLPSRRGGAWLRWKNSNAVALRRARRAAENLVSFAKFFVWYLPKFLVWDVPKYFLWTAPRKAWPHIKAGGIRLARGTRALAVSTAKGIAALPGVVIKFVHAIPAFVAREAAFIAHAIRETAPKVWAAFKDAAAKCGRAIKSAPAALALAGKRAARATASFARGARRISKEIAIALRDMATEIAKWLWRGILAIPDVIRAAARWIKESATTIGKGIASVLGHALSLLHTGAMAVVSLLKRVRNVTFKDLVAAMSALVGAILALPGLVLQVAERLWETSWYIGVKLFGWVYVVVGAIAWLTFQAVMFVPNQLGKIALAIGGSVKNGGHEVASWINPKW